MGLDLSRVEAWTREKLDAEARRRRIRNPQFRTRGELIRLLLKHQYGDRFSAGRERIARGMRTFEQARELLGMAVGAALSAMPETLGALGLGRDTGRHRQEEEREKEEEAPRDAGGERDENVYGHEAQVAATTQTAATSQSAATQVATTRTFVEEPIRTRTMARLLSGQGHRERALAIYEELLAQNSADDTLQGEAEAVRRGETLEEPLLPDPPFPPERWPTPQAGDRLECSGDPSRGLTLRWQVTGAGARRACAVLGSDGELTLRVVSIQPDPERVVRSEITEHGPVGAAGEWSAPPLVPGARCFAAVGVRAGSRFVAIVHAHPNASNTGQSIEAHAHAPA